MLQAGCVDKREGGERLLTHLGAAGRGRWGVVTSGQPCTSRKPRRWPQSKVCLVNCGDFWHKMKWSNGEARTISFSSLSLHRETSTLLKSSILTREFWTQIRVQRVQIYTENRTLFPKLMEDTSLRNE